MRLSKYILPNLIGLCTVLIMLILGLTPVQAQQQQATANANILVSLAANGDAEVTYSFNLQNSSEDYINDFNLYVPFPGISNVRATLDGATVKASGSAVPNGSQVVVKFASKVIKTDQSKFLQISFRTDAALKKHAGFEYFIVYPFNSRFKLLSTTYQIDVPAGRTLAYASTKDFTQEGGRITLTPSSSVLFIWGSKEINTGITMRLAAPSNDTLNVASLPLQLAEQQVSYRQIAGAEQVGKRESDGNLWAFIPADQTLEADLNLQTSANPISKIPELPRCIEQVRLPSELEPSGLKPVDIYKYFESRYIFGTGGELDTKKLADKLSSGGGELNQLELYCAISSILTQKGVKNAIQYGYLLVDIFPGVEANLPQVWLVVEQGGEFRIFNPLFGGQSGLAEFDIPETFYLKMGWFDIRASYDSVLGLRSGIPVVRPTLVPAFEITESTEVAYEFKFPSQVYAGEFFTGAIEIENYTPKVLGISELKIDNTDYTLGSTRLIPGIYQQLIPGSNQVAIDFLREPNFLRDAIKTHVISIKVPELLSAFEGQMRIRYVPDVKIFMVLAAAIVTLVVFGAYFVFVRVARYSRANYKAYRQVYAPPQLSKPNLKFPTERAPEQEETKVITLDEVLN